MKRSGDFITLLILVGISTLLAIPGTREVYEGLNSSYPFILGFIKFMVLASIGELLALRIIIGHWQRTKGFVYKAVIWGLIGMLIVFMFKMYQFGVADMIAAGILPQADGFAGRLIQGFFASLIMNLTFGPVFMAAHRISDTYIDSRVDKSGKSLGQVIESIDWSGFIRFVVAKTQPFFWIPVHTIVFILPKNFQVIVAAYLSIALGIILATARKKNLGASAPAKSAPTLEAVAE